MTTIHSGDHASLLAGFHGLIVDGLTRIRTLQIAVCKQFEGGDVGVTINDDTH